VLPLRTAKAIVFFFVNQSASQILAVSNATAPEWDEGLFALRCQRADDGRRTIATIGYCFVNRQRVPLFDPFELLQVRLVVMPGSRGDVRI